MTTSSLVAKIDYVCKRIEGRLVVWFAKSNQWVLFDEMNQSIFEYYLKEQSQQQATDSLSSRYPIMTQEAKERVANIYASISELTNPSFQLPSFDMRLAQFEDSKPCHLVEHTYAYAGKLFTLAYGSSFLEDYVHSPFVRLEKSPLRKLGLHIELIEVRGKYAMCVNHQKAWQTNEAGQLKRLLYIELANYFYQKEEKDWMCLMHASGVLRGEQLLLFSSASGSGKSTLTGAMQKQGFKFFSDDFIPVDMKTKKAFPFPAALCAKGESIELLKSEGLAMSCQAKSSFTFFSPFNAPAVLPEASVNSIIFVRYKAAARCELKPMSVLDALSIFLEESWVSDYAEGAEAFLNWVETLHFYTLSHGGYPEAVREVLNLLDRSSHA